MDTIDDFGNSTFLREQTKYSLQWTRQCLQIIECIAEMSSFPNRQLYMLMVIVTWRGPTACTRQLAIEVRAVVLVTLGREAWVNYTHETSRL